MEIFHLLETKDSDYQLTGSTSGTPLATQNTPDGLPPSSLPAQQTNNHLQGLPAYSHNDYTNYPTLPVSTTRATEVVLMKFSTIFARDTCVFIQEERNVVDSLLSLCTTPACGLQKFCTLKLLQRQYTATHTHINNKSCFT